jgi:hypothetical protein
VERYQQSLKREVNQLTYKLPSQLEKAIADFVDYYNCRRYHKALGDVTPADVLYGRREEIWNVERRCAYKQLIVAKPITNPQGSLFMPLKQLKVFDSDCVPFR